MNNLSVDRIEGKIAVCTDDNYKIVNIPVSEISGGIKEGDIIVMENGIYIKDEYLTEKIREENIAMTKKLFEK